MLESTIFFQCMTGWFFAVAGWVFHRVIRQLDRLEERVGEHRADLVAIKTHLGMPRRAGDWRPPPQPPL